MITSRRKRDATRLHLQNVSPRTIAPIETISSSFVHLTSANYENFAAHIFWSRSRSIFLVNLSTLQGAYYLEPARLNDAPGSKFTPADLVYIQMQAENYARDYLKEPYLSLEFKMSSEIPAEFNRFWEFHFAATVPSAREIKARCLISH